MRRIEQDEAKASERASTVFGPEMPGERLARAGDYLGAVEALVRERDCVSFVEIERLLGPFMPVKGSMALTRESDENVIFWYSMSPEFIRLIEECQQQQRIFMHRCSWLIYVIDGRVPQLPLAKTNPRNGYRSEHWAPVCFRPAPHRKKPRSSQGRRRKANPRDE